MSMSMSKVSRLVGIGLLTAAVGCGETLDAQESIGSSQSALTGAGRYIVKFRDVERGKAALHGQGAKVELELGPQGAAAARIPGHALAALRANPHVEYIEEDPIREPMAQVTPYGITMVQADDPGLPQPTAANRVVCIIDSGYSRTHEDLEGNALVTGGGVSNWYQDDCGHGSHVAGTIAAVNNDVGVVGVIGNGNVRIHAVKVFTGEACDWTYASNLVGALNECRNAGANVINMSLGGGSPSVTEQNAFASAYSAGVLSIAAAGNGGTTSGTTDPVAYPAGYSTVVSVGALDIAKTHGTFSQENSDVELAAPGVDVDSTVPYAEDNRLTVGASPFAGGRIEGAARSAGVSGVLVDGGLCNSVGSWSGKVVVCQRGTITFNEKVVNVRQGGGVAAVIYNNAPGNFNGTLGDGVTSTIPAISLSDTDGAAVVGLAGSAGTVVSQRLVSDDAYDAYQGTSMATPHVAGVAALVWSHFPACTNVQVRNALTSTAQDLGAAGRDISFGYGLVQAKAAYDQLSAGCGATGNDTTPPVISNVASAKTSKNGSFRIMWTTNEASSSVVTFTGGATGTFSDAALVTSHSMSFRGSRGATYTYVVSSTDAAGNTSTAGPFTHQN
jgi:serine protease